MQSDRLDSAFSLKMPSVDEYIRTMTIQFAESTNATSPFLPEEAAEIFRKELLEGVLRGETQAGLVARIYRIYRDPNLAALIADTECSRALNGGQWLEAKSWPGNWKKEWLASSDACERCLAIDGKRLCLNEPFYIDPYGGSLAVVQHPPLHTSCACTLTYAPE
jgi:hypothetical protein